MRPVFVSVTYCIHAFNFQRLCVHRSYKSEYSHSYVEPWKQLKQQRHHDPPADIRSQQQQPGHDDDDDDGEVRSQVCCMFAFVFE